MSIENKDLYDQSNSQAIPQGETPERNNQNPIENQEIPHLKEDNNENREENNEWKAQEEQERKRQEELRKQEEIRRRQAERYRKAKEAFPALAKTPNLNPQIIETLIKFSEKFISKEQKQLSIKDTALFSIRKLQKNAGNMAFDENNPQYKIVKEKIQLLFNKATPPQKISSAIHAIQEIMRYANYEQKRGELNARRIAPKMEALSKIIDKNNMGEAQQISDQCWNLTFEVFLDDFLYKRFPIPNTTNITELYSAWEFYYIIKLSNKTPERYKRAIETTTENNQRFKNQALAKVKDPSNLGEIKIANEESNRKAKEVNGLLNRQELMIAALNSPKTEQDLIKIIQIIGQVYYNNKEISLDGNRWRQTQSIVEKLIDEFENNEKFKKHNCIQKLKTLKQKKKKYDTRNTKARLDRYMQASIFDTQKTTAYYKIHPEENPLLKDTTKGAQKKENIKDEGNATNKLTGNTFEDINNETVDNMIPYEEEKAAATDFVKRLEKQGIISISEKKNNTQDTEAPDSQEDQNSLTFKSIEEATRTILNGEISTPELNSLNEARNKSPEKQKLFYTQKELLTQALRFSASETVVRAWSDFLRKMGIQLQWTQKLITETSWVSYYEFTSIEGIKYYYRPETGNISTPKLNTIDHKQKRLKIWSQDSYQIIHHIPRYDQLIAQAQSLAFLNTQKPNSNEELAKIIKDWMQSNIDLNVWELETDSVKNIINKETLKTKITRDIQEVLSSTETLNLSQTNNQKLYQSLQPLLNTLTNPNIEASELDTLHKFIKILKEQFNLSRTNQQKINANPETMTSLSQIQLKTPQELFALISNHLEIQKLKDPTQRKREEKSEFWISILLKFLEKNIPGESSEFNIINIKKLEPLINNMTDPNILKKPEYSKLISSIKNLYPRVIEANARKKEESELEALEHQFTS